MIGHPSLHKLEDIIARASEIAMRWSRDRTNLLLNEKSAGQFASNADIEVEQFIREELARNFPGQPVIGEELGGRVSATGTGWAIDPIDGTSNFVLGLPLWGISVGYMENGCSILGAISLPELQLTLSAAQGSGLRLNKESVPHLLAASPVRVIAHGENDYETGPQTDARAQSFRDQGFAVVRYRCAVASLAFSALKRLHGYIEYGCGLWDIAAAEIICREGGRHECADILPL